MAKREEKKLSFSLWGILILNWLAIIGLVFSYLSVVINPSWFSLPQFFAVIYPWLLLINILFVVFWIWQWRKYFLYSLLAIFIGLGFVHRTFNFSQPERIYPSSFSMMSYNVRLFNVYKWNGNGYTDKEVFELVKSKSPDLLCLQEFLDNKKIHSLNKFLSLYPYYLISYDKTAFKAGEAIFSKYKILNYGRLRLDNHIFAIFADINLDDRLVRVINVHLRSVALESKDYNALDSLKFNNNRLRRIVLKLTTGYRYRQREVRNLVQLIDTSRYPILLCGDFNDTPLSYTYSQIVRRLTDAFTVAGWGIGNTYNEYLPILRIDYIFVSDDFHILDFDRIKIRYSDHYPIWAEISKD